MKIAGVELNGAPNEELLVLKRGETLIPVRARAIDNMDEFETLCPPPQAPGVRTKNGWEPNTKDETYRKLLAVRYQQRIAYLVINSLLDTEWDTVKPDDPKTWSRWQEDLKKAGLNQVEIGLILQLVLQANCLDEDKLEEARQLFLRGRREAQSESSGPQTEPESSPSGEPANASA